MQLPFNLRYDLQTFRGDAFGGVTTAVVSLPMAMALGETSGLGALAGLYGSVAVGFFAAVFGGTKGQVTGVTAPMCVAMAVVVAAYADNLASAFTIVIMAGLIQIAMGVLGIGRFVAYTPYSVISGFMSGVGIIIILVQTLPFMGVDIVLGGPLEAVRNWPDAIRNVNFEAVAIAAVTLAVNVFWPKRLRKHLPRTLAALVAGGLLGVFWLTGAPVIGDVSTGLPTLRLPEFAPSLLVDAVFPALTIALIGAIGSLLTSLVADSITHTQHNPNRELVGQGIANMATGFVGGPPGAGATTGTVVNLRAGGRTQVSGVLRAATLLAVVLGLGGYVEKLPFAVLAGILVKAGWDTIDWRFLTRLHRVQREHLLVMLITLGLTIFLDLTTAVAIGLIAAGMAGAREFERLQMDSVVSVPLLDRSFLASQGDAAATDAVDEDDTFSARVGLVSLRGSFSVASSSKMISAIGADIRDHEVVILDFSDTVYMDDSAALVVEQLIDTAIEQDTGCIVMGLTGSTAAALNGLNVLKRVPAGHIVASLDEARETARGILAGQTRP